MIEFTLENRYLIVFEQQRLKSGPMKFVKQEKTLKSDWSKLRRQIVPKIGQLTNDAQAISQIVSCLCLADYHIPDVCLDTTNN